MPPSTGLESLGLVSWPFNVVPDQDGPLLWADRVQLLSQIRRLVRRLSRTPSSALHLLWADFGAGKTHTLLYLKQLASLETTVKIFPVYAVLPRASRSFVDIYRAIIQGVGFDCLLEAYVNVRGNGQNSDEARRILSDNTPGLFTAFEALRVGSNFIKETSTRWLSADTSLTRKELNDASLPGRIRTTDEALPVLSAITKLLLRNSSRVLLMIDEFQRVGMLRRAYLDEINTGLHTYFNDCPRGLSLVLSFSFGSKDNIGHHLNDELRSRADPSTFTIPALTVQTGNQFLTDLVDASKVPDKEVNVSSDVYSAIVKYVAEQGIITPRKLMHAANFVFSEASLDLEDGVIASVEAEYARDLLDNLQPSNLPEQV